MSKIVIIGGGIAGLASACFLAKAGKQVTLLEKNSAVGGRCRSFEAEGFTFDMGPSWYWMPDVFEDFFNKFDKKTSDFYKLIRLDPSYKVFFPEDEVNIPASYEKLRDLLESWEKGAAKNLDT